MCVRVCSCVVSCPQDPHLLLRARSTETALVILHCHQIPEVLLFGHWCVSVNRTIEGCCASGLPQKQDTVRECFLFPATPTPLSISCLSPQFEMEFPIVFVTSFISKSSCVRPFRFFQIGMLLAVTGFDAPPNHHPLANRHDSWPSAQERVSGNNRHKRGRHQSPDCTRTTRHQKGRTATK